MRSFRYTNSKGATISLGANSIPSTLEDGLVGCWPMENIQEYPTGTAVYLQGTLSTDTWSGWAYSGAGGSIAITGGNLLLTCGAANCGFVRTMAVAANQTFRLRVTCGGNYGSRTISIYNGTTDTIKAITASTSPQVVDILSSLTFATVTIRIANGAATETYFFDWIYIGDGSYAANSLLDNSGNGNHGQIFGATPVDGVSGKALIGNGTSNYMQGNISGLTGSVTLAAWIKRVASGVVQYATSIGGTATIDRLAGRFDASNNLTLSRLVSGSAIVSTIQADDGNWHHVVFTHDGSSTKAYVDGLLKLSVAEVIDNTVNGVVRFLARGQTSPSSYFSGLIDEPRIYNRALSAAEVNALYRFRAAPFIATGETAYGIIESVEGIDSADADIQSTRAPLQDGQTYIDSLFDSREVVVRGSIMVPKNLDTIYARRKIILDALNPKYGNGSLDFFYGANTINHRVLQNVVVEKVQFPNKPFQNPFQEFQITFRANDPYFYEPLTDTHGIQILSGESRTFTVGGEQDTPVAIRIYGAATNPAATNSTVGETIALTYSLAGGSYIDIDTRFGSKTIKLNGATSLIGNLNIGSSFWNLRVGSNTVSYTGGGYVILLWRERYIGV